MYKCYSIYNVIFAFHFKYIYSIYNVKTNVYLQYIMHTKTNVY